MIAGKDFAGSQCLGSRRGQEDAYAFSELPNGEGILVVVADGMGGHSAGELASELALKSFIAAFHDTQGKVARRLDEALRAANDAIAAELERDPRYEGMGTTLVAACVTPAGLEWISVGDSPLYLWSNGKLRRLNEDHSLRPVVSEMAQQGKIPAGDPSGNVLRSALIGEDIAMIDRSKEPASFSDGDVVLAATDGIHTLKDAEIAAMAASGGDAASEMASRFIHAIEVTGAPKQDNTTVAVVRSTAR